MMPHSPGLTVSAVGAALVALIASCCIRHHHPLPEQVLRQRFPNATAGHELAGHYTVVTGANTGVGLETAKGLALAGVTVILGCRSASRCADARHAVERVRPGAAAVPAPLDLENLTSIREFAAAVEGVVQGTGLQLLVLNAGVTGVGWLEVRRSALTHRESRFMVNHLGHFYLAQLLHPVLRRGAALGPGPSRVVVVASRSHKFRSEPCPDRCLARGFFRGPVYFFFSKTTWSWPSSTLSPTAVGYPPTAVGYPPTAVGYPPTAFSYTPTAVGHPFSAIGWSSADFADHRTHQLFFFELKNPLSRPVSSCFKQPALKPVALSMPLSGPHEACCLAWPDLNHSAPPPPSDCELSLFWVAMTGCLFRGGMR